MADLIPPDSTEIISTTEDVADSQVITSTLATVLSWDWDIIGDSPAPDNPPEFVVTDQGQSLLIEYDPSPFLFPLEYVEYQDQDRNRVRISGVDAWQHVPPPEQSPQILKMREDTKALLTWTASVTATGLDGDGLPDEASADYIITVFANYDMSRDLLIAAVDERR